MKAKGIASSSTYESRLVRPVGSSKGWAPFALNGPPPFVPSCLMTSWEAIGPLGMTPLAPFSRLWKSTGPASVWRAPSPTKITVATKAIGSKM